MENQSGCKLRTIRSDNGKEYANDTFHKFCEEAGIEHQLIVPYTPQQNGVSERKKWKYHEDDKVYVIWKGVAKEAVGRGYKYCGTFA